MTEELLFGHKLLEINVNKSTTHMMLYVFQHCKGIYLYHMPNSALRLFSTSNA
jgi:hypothetical protein